MAAPQLRRVLSLTDVVLFNVAAVFSLRAMATAAKMGPLSIVLWLLAVGTFFVPLSFALAELSSRDPGQGGLYRWTRNAFGAIHGFLCAWFYWVSNLVYFPSLLFYLAANVVFVVAKPGLGQEPGFVIALSLGVLWIAALLNVRGLSVGRWLANGGAAASWLAALLLIAAGLIAFLRFGSATPWSVGAVASALGEPRTVAYFATLTFALVGCELAPIMGEEIQDPKRVLARALLLSSVLIAGLYLLGTLAILVAAPPDAVSPQAGALDAVAAVSARAGWPLLPRLVGLLVALGAVGGATVWLAGAARLPFAAGLDRFLPQSLARLHPRYGTPHVAILVQAALCTVFIVLASVGSTVREAYLLVLDMTIFLTAVPFLYIFASLPRLRQEAGALGAADVIRVPGGRAGMWAVVLLGLGATGLTLVTSTIPPSDVANPMLFEAKLWGGLAFFSLTGLLLFWRFSRGAPAARTISDTIQ
ncbi:MAG: amino acid permease [Gemmatimonadetes bacterium]|nr:amino acid permease [Gemmatimonadota bacterium]